jgi:TatD DNase family protein
MPLVDSHCHLQDAKFDDDREQVIQRALDTVEWLVVIGDDLASSRAAATLIRPNVYAAVGIHPYYAATVTPEALDELRAMARAPSVVAIGEIGLDYFKYNDTPRVVQAKGFRSQLELAAELALPVVIHNRESTDDLCAILDEYHTRLPGGVMHCFAGDAAFVDRTLSWGFHISFAGNVTFPKAVELRDAARLVPLDKLLVETDAPYLAPQPVRGKRCEPAHVQLTAESLAETTGIDLEDLRTATTRNAAELFLQERSAP